MEWTQRRKYNQGGLKSRVHAIMKCRMTALFVVQAVLSSSRIWR
jgi:hypothetical protein